MKKSGSQDNVVAYIAAGVVIICGLALGVAWSYRNAAEKNPADVAYATFGPFRIQAQGFAFRTSVAIQTRTEHVKWAEQNKANLDNLFQKVLTETDPSTVLTRAGLESTQNTLKDAINTSMKTDKIQAVLVTDFLMVSNDD